jgi:hypothetical protein
MPKQGFSSTGGRPPISPKNTPGYTPQEISAMSKLSHVGGDRLGDAGFGGDPNHVVLCKLCGRPISSASPFDREGDRFDYYEQARYEVHFKCNMANADRQKKAAEAKIAAMSPDERQAQEDREAAAFNAGNQFDPKEEALAKPKPYTFKPGERPIEKGPPKDEKFSFTPETDPEILAKAAERERAEREEFQAFMEQNKVISQEEAVRNRILATDETNE